VVFKGIRDDEGAGLFIQPLDGGAARPLSGARPGFGLIAVSPTGDRFATSGPDGAPWIFSLTGPAKPLPGCLPGDTAIRWDVGGHHLFVVRGTEVPAPIRRVREADGSATPVRSLGLKEIDGVQHLSPLAMTADARTVVFSYYRLLSELHVVEGLGP
jgi:hypothetical protein